jgi:hypothetical protein
VSHVLDSLTSFLASPAARPFGVIAGEVVLYFLAGRAVAALMPRGEKNASGSRYTCAYVAVGALAVNFVVFLALAAGIGSLRFAYVLAVAPFVVILILRTRAALAFQRGWALLALILLIVAFRVPGASLLQAEPYYWDEFTHWANRPRQILSLNRLPLPGEPAAVVAPHYGLFATLLAVGADLPLGRECVGAGVAWSLVFTLLMAVHCYEHLRRHGVARLVAGPACAWLAAAVCRGQPVLAMSMYADVFVAFGGMLALFHLLEFARPPDNAARRAEDGLLAATGLGILLFTKTTGDVVAAAVVGYVFAVGMVSGIRRRAVGSILAGWLALLVAVLPAVVIRGTWMWWGERNNPDPGRLLLEQGVAVDRIVHPPEASWIAVLRAFVDGPLRESPYALLITALPFAWLIDALLRRGDPRPSPAARLSALAGFAPILIVVFAVVFNCTFGLRSVSLDGGRYLAAILPVVFCYVVGVGSRLLEWSVAFDRGDSYTCDEPAGAVPGGHERPHS